MKNLVTILFLLPFASIAQKDSIASGAYNWQQPAPIKNTITSISLVQGMAHDFEWMQLSANSLAGTKELKQSMPADQEQLLIVRSGSITIHFKDSSFILTPNSIAVLMPGEKYSLRNASKERCDFYSMRYRKASSEMKMPAGKSFVKIWENIPFKPNNIGGGRRDFFEQSTAMQKRFEIHVSTLKEGMRSHDPHTHRAEEIVLLIEGDTEMQVGDQFKKVNAGGFYYLGSNVLHAIKNIGTKPSTYFAIQFE